MGSFRPTELAVDMLRAHLAQGKMVTLRGQGRSMFPALSDGDAFVVAAADKLEIGDVVVLNPEPGLLVAHRIISIMHIDGDTIIQTKGDNANAPDRSISAKCAVGKVVTGRALRVSTSLERHPG